MKKILAVTGAMLLATMATAGVSTTVNDVDRQNALINRECKKLVQIKNGYAHLPALEREVRDREFSTSIQSCYTTHAIVPVSS